MTSAGAREFDTCQQDGRWILSLRARLLFAKVVAVFPFTRAETLVPLLHDLNDLLGSQHVAHFLRQGVCARLISQEEAATCNSGHGACRQL